MSRLRAVFLDRDDTISRVSPVQAQAMYRAIGEIVGVPDFSITNDDYTALFTRTMAVPGIAPVNTPEREEAFWLRWMQFIFEDHGLTEGAAELSAEVRRRFVFHTMMEPFPETREVLQALKDRGLKLGVISDTYPSLKASLESMGIAHYLDSIVASMVVGISKPDPRIFEIATNALGVKPQESVFVDDLQRNVDGARAAGMTAFRIDRSAATDFSGGVIASLRDLIAFADGAA
ncbi:MAG TPA: HAD-IA family hydrolase [Armatimonadota bacterium]|nr:HAD-IA family hydrolase [Armatimonadota bacterium]HQK95434.1 HAD-IA family hydrolase [Armatimonadota bacterium]